MPELGRRDFLKLVGAGAGGAAASACSDPVETLIPYVVQPETITPGLPVVYASTCRECPAGCGLHVRTREGRPIKLEGNPDHPVNRGVLCARGQAGTERSYHPGRYRGPQRREGDQLVPTTWDEATALLAQKLRAAPGRVRILGGQRGPTLAGLIDRWASAVGAGERLVYEPFAHEALARASEAVFGLDGRPDFDLSGVDFLIDFGADVLDAWLSPAEHQRQIGESRALAAHPEGGARFVSVGPRLSLTAGNADEWLPARPGSEGLLALGIARAAFDERRRMGRSVPDADLLEPLLAEFDAAGVAPRSEVPAETIERLGRELAHASRPVALPPGVALTGQRATATAAAVLILDAVVGAVGESVQLRSASAEEPASLRELGELVAAMRSGEVSVLLVHDTNPIYSLPPGLGFAEALEQVFVVSFASLPDETSERANLVLPDHTPLESWGDAETRPGLRSLIQPTLRPLYDTQALGDTLLQTARALGDDVASQLPQGSFRDVLEEAWPGDLRAALARGGDFGAPASATVPSISPGVAGLDFEEPPLEGEGRVLLALPSPLLGDGRGADLPWLQETPDPVTKVAWQSWAEISRETARELGVGVGDLLSVETQSGRVEVPALPRGGIRDDVVAIAIGQGHTVGHFASLQGDGRTGEARGVNAISLLPVAEDETGGRAWLSTRARLSATGGHERLPITQGTDNKRGRQLAESVTLASLASNGGHAGGDDAAGHGEGHEEQGHGGGHGAAHEIHKPFDPAGDAVDESPYRWGMAIDLDRCTGCSACVVACSIENNVPVVGEEGVRRSRQMQWIRIERYVGEGEADLQAGRPSAREDREKLGDVDVRHSPMLCQQCGAAPCEPVCPVLATYHNPEGLNGMIYNRCIGTRYCSNNCPYKVRRYNWFDYAIHKWPEPMALGLNPDVTVRGQGVMEKCTFCVQRIESARQLAKDADRTIRDGEVTPACAQTCPSRAITFGNLRDDGSRLAAEREAAESRRYHALHVLNTRPAVTYLAKVRRGGSGSDA